MARAALRLPTVRVSVAGDFPGSPIALTYQFELHAHKIAGLAIG
jgi:hypothetical protein